MRRKFSSQNCINTQPTELKNRLLYQRYYSKTIHSTSFRLSLSTSQYSALLLFWPLEDSAELAEGPAGCGEMGRSRRYFLGTSVWQSQAHVLYSTEAERTLDQHDAVVELVTHSQLAEWLADGLTYLGTYYLYFLSYFMKQRSSSKDKRFSASQEMARILWNPKVHYSVCKSMPPVPIWAKTTQSMPPNPTSWASILVSSHLSLGFLSGLFPIGFSTKTQHASFLAPVSATCPAHLTLFHLITQITGEAWRSISSSLCSFLHSNVTSSL